MAEAVRPRSKPKAKKKTKKQNNGYLDDIRSSQLSTSSKQESKVTDDKTISNNAEVNKLNNDTSSSINENILKDNKNENEETVSTIDITREVVSDCDNIATVSDLKENRSKDVSTEDTSVKTNDLVEHTVTNSELHHEKSDNDCDANKEGEKTSSINDGDAISLKFENKNEVEDSISNLEEIVQENNETINEHQVVADSESAVNLNGIQCLNLDNEFIENNTNVSNYENVTNLEKEISSGNHKEVIEIENPKNLTQTDVQDIMAASEFIASAPPMSLPSLESQQDMVSLRALLNVAEESIEAFTEQQLSLFYYNQELLQLDGFIDDFIRNSNQEGHEFYEMVETYQKSRGRLVDVEEKIKGLQERCSTHQKDVWKFEKKFIKAKGTCACGVAVEQDHQYQQGHYNKKVAEKLSDELAILRSQVNETIQLEYYNSNHLKIKIDDYLARIYRASKVRSNKIKTDVPVSALLPRDISPDHIPFLCIVRECITVLFAFKRITNLEEVFKQHLDVWLNVLVATLQKLGTLPDSFFILNHLLRCPPDSVTQMAHFIQFPAFTTQADFLPIFDRPQIHHFVVMLATLTLPVKSRKEFLMKLHCDSRDYPRTISWTLVDESKDEVEQCEDSWSFLTEGDLMALLEQFPLNGLLRAVLSFKEGENPYSPVNTSSHDMMRTFALFTCIVNLLGRIFDTYNMLRYRRVVQTASCNIRVIVQVISDHWAAYKDYHVNIVGDLFSTVPVSNNGQPQFSLQRLQIEFDQFFKRAVKMILHSHNSGAIQFLSIMPFEALSSHSLWMLLDMLLKREQSDENHVGGFAGATINISPSEGIFLLTTLSNMATSRNSVDHEFVETIVRCVIDISFLNESLFELYNKNGHDMLVDITTSHPSSISTMLHHVKNNLKLLGKDTLYIFEELPFEKWKPTMKDIELLRCWLLESSLTSCENNLSRNILLKLNYNEDKDQESLFLPVHFHYLCAILVVEAYGLSFPDYPGGIRKLDYDALGLLGQVSKIAVSSYNRIVYNQLHTEYLSWAWKVLLKLKLHQSDMAGLIESDDDLPVQGSHETWTVKTLKSLKQKKSFDFDVALTPELINVHIALENKGLLATYVAFAMTKHGHFVDLFLNKGIAHLKLLAANSSYDAVLRIINSLTSLFVRCPEKLMTDSYAQVLLTMVHVDVDNAGYTEKLWQYFVTGVYSRKLSALISNQVRKCNQIQSVKIIGFWMTILLKLPYWSRDYSVLYQVDCLCKVAFTIPGGLTLVTDIMHKEFKSLVHVQEKKGLLSSMMSWISTSQVISFMPKLTGDFCYLASVVMTVETKFERDISIWKELTAELLNGGHASLDQAYKKMLGNIKSFYAPPLYELSIYRWSTLAMAAPYDHPFTPILWQNFFIVFLQRQDASSGISGQRGIGLLFFDSMSTSNIARKMKTHLQALASYHQEKSVSNEETSLQEWKFDEAKHFYEKDFHQKLSRMYQSFALWIDESRLHDPNLYLTSLPDVYNAPLLEKIFQGNQDIWVEFIDYDCVVKEIDLLANIWTDLYYKISREQIKMAPSHSEANQRIIKRLERETEHIGAPQLVIPKSSIRETSSNVLLIRPQLLQEVNNSLEYMLKYAKSASSFSASHVALDLEFSELLRDCYENVNRRMVVGIPCDGRHRRRYSQSCKSPAEVTIEFKELVVKERILGMVTENRCFHKDMVQSCTKFITEDLCISAVRINNIINKLELTFQHSNTNQRGEIQNNATYLFYLLAQLIDDDIKRCFPAIQFFSTSVEKLGKTFIANHSSEQMPLIEAICRQESSIIFVAPYFTPMSAPEYFVELYAKVASLLKHIKPTSVFVLLSKFDMNGWLSRNPPLSDRTNVIACALDALRQLGFEPNTEGLVLLEIYRTHMLALLMTCRADLFGKVVLQFLQGSSEKSLSPLCWDDLLSAIEYDPDNEPDPIPYAIIKDTLEYMGSFYLHNIDQLGSQLDIFYEIWQHYCKPLNKLLYRMFYSFIRHNINLMNDYNRDQILNDIWEITLTPYRPWLLPRMPGKIWTLLRNESVTYMVQSMTEIFRMIIEMSSKTGGSKYSIVMSYIWSFYFNSVVVSVTEDQSLEIFNNAFSTLPWSMFCPSVQELDNVLQCHENYPSAFRFFGCLLPEIEWASVLATYKKTGDSESLSQLHQKIFRIFTLVAVNKDILKLSASKLIYLFCQAKTFHWETIRLEETSLSCKWYAENVDSSLLLVKDSIVWVALDLFKNVCGFTDYENSSNTTISTKRNLYVQLMVTILIRCSNNKKTSDSFPFVLEHLLQVIESSINFNKEAPLEELTLHASTFLNLLNMISNNNVTEIVKSSIETHMFNTQCGFVTEAFLSAALRSMANIQQMVWLLETCIKCHFMRLSDQELSNSWMAVYASFSPPELDKEAFVKEAIKQKAVLTLYSYNLFRIPRCQDANEKVNILNDIVQWCTKINPDRESESKLLLLWLQIFDIVRSFVTKTTSGNHLNQISRDMIYLAHACQICGEDKIYNGVLGAIGIGRRSAHSKEFRLSAKALHLFILSQMPSTGNSLRVVPDAPGSICQNKDARIRATSDTEKAFSNFQSLSRNKVYNGRLDDIKWVLEFISNPKVNLLDGCSLIVYFCTSFFCKENFIAAAVNT